MLCQPLRAGCRARRNDGSKRAAALQLLPHFSRLRGGRFQDCQRRKGGQMRLAQRLPACGRRSRRSVLGGVSASSGGNGGRRRRLCRQGSLHRRVGSSGAQLLNHALGCAARIGRVVCGEVGGVG